MALKDDIDVPLIVSLGFSSTIVVALSVVGTQALYYKVEHDLTDQRYADLEASGTMPRQVWVDQDADNHKYQWMNEGKTYAHVPVESAIKVLAKNKGKVPTTQPSR